MPTMCQKLFLGSFNFRIKDYWCEFFYRDDKDLIADARPSPPGQARRWHKDSHWVGNSGDAVGSGPLRFAGTSPRLSPKHIRGWGRWLWSERKKIRHSVDSGCIWCWQKISTCLEWQRMSPTLFCNRFLTENWNICNKPAGALGGALISQEAFIWDIVIKNI